MPSPNVTVIVSALDETDSLRETIDTLMADNGDDILEIMVAIAPRTTGSCRAVIAEMATHYPGLVRSHEQVNLPGVGGAIRECLELARGEWIIMMAADLETPPPMVKTMLATMRHGNTDIVAASRWHTSGGFGDYSRVKFICNWGFNLLFSTLYRTSLTDMTYGFRLFHATVLRRFVWQETGFAFFFETTVKPLRGGCRIVEIPVQWRRRQEGVSHFRLREYLHYIRIGIITRFQAKRHFQRNNA